MVTASNTFGCNTCWTPDANDAWVAAKLLRLKFELADESHFMVKLRRVRIANSIFYRHLLKLLTGRTAKIHSSVACR